MSRLKLGTTARSVPRLSNLEELFALISAWRREESHSSLRSYLRASWKPKSRNRPLLTHLQRSEEAMKLLRRWSLVNADGNPGVTCFLLCGQFESNRQLFRTSL